MNKQELKKFKFTSYDKSYSTEIHIKNPDKYREIEKDSSLSDDLISMGSGFSYAPASFKEKTLSLKMDKFNRILHFDKKEKVITVEAGIKIYELLNFTLQHNLWLTQIPGYPLISIGGAVASNSHGKSCGIDGTIRHSIKSISLFHKTNGWINLSEKENQEIFDLTIGGLGLTGTIVSVTLKLVDFDGKFETTKQEVNSVKETINKIKKTEPSTFIYSWNMANDKNSFGKGIVFKNKILKTQNKKYNFKVLKKKNLLPINFWNKYSIKFSNFFFYNFHKLLKKSLDEKFLDVIFPFYGKEIYFNLFGSKGFIESQLIIPEKNIDEFFNEFLHLNEKLKPSITLFSIKNMSGKQKLIRFEDNNICVTFDFVNNKKNKEFLQHLDKLCIKYQILPSIIKDSRLEKDIFDKCYSEADIFRDKLSKFDKRRYYKSEISNRLKL